MVFRLSQLSQLNGLKLRAKQQVLQIALSLLDSKTKVILRIAKLLLLTPFFASLAIFEGWVLLPVLLVAGLVYPLFTTPVEIFFAKPKLDEALQQYNDLQSEQS